MMGGGSPSPHMLPPDDEAIRCNCGFSAVVNRRLSYKAGLFIEDELEITGSVLLLYFHFTVGSVVTQVRRKDGADYLL